MLCLHSNLLTDIDMEKKEKKSFSHRPLTKPFENILSTFFSTGVVNVNLIAIGLFVCCCCCFQGYICVTKRENGS